MSGKYGLVAEPLLFHYERSQIFNLRAAENDRSSAKLVAGLVAQSNKMRLY